MPRAGDVGTKYLKAATIAQMISYGRSSVSSRKVGLVMRKLGYASKHTESGNVYRVFELDPNQAQQCICAQLDSEPAEIQKVAAEEELPF